MPQSKSTAHPRHQKEEEWGTNKDNTNPTNGTTDEEKKKKKKKKKTTTEEPPWNGQ